MRESFQVELTKTDYIVGLEALTGELVKRDDGAPRRIYERLGVMVVLVLAVSYFFPRSASGIWFFIIAWALVEWAMARRWTKSAHGVSFDPAVGAATIEFSDAGITETSALRSRQWQWDAVRKIHDRKAALVFELIGWDMIILPSSLWPDGGARQRFLSEAKALLPDQSSASVSADPPLLRLGADFFQLAAIAAFVDACLIVSLLLPEYTRRYGPLAGQVGFVAGMLLVVLISTLLGYLAYRAVKVGLPKLHRRSPMAAQVAAQVLIWAFAAWFAGAYAGWW